MKASIIKKLTNYWRQISSKTDEDSNVKSRHQGADGFHCFRGHVFLGQYKWKLLDEPFINQVDAVTKNKQPLLIKALKISL